MRGVAGVSPMAGCDSLRLPATPLFCSGTMRLGSSHSVGIAKPLGRDLTAGPTTGVGGGLPCVGGGLPCTEEYPSFMPAFVQAVHSFKFRSYGVGGVGL